MDYWTSKMYVQIYQGGDLEVWFKAAPDEVEVNEYDLLLYQCNVANNTDLQERCWMHNLKKRGGYNGIQRSVSA